MVDPYKDIITRLDEYFRRMEASSIEDLNTKLAILIVSITYTAQNAKKGQALTGADIATIEQAANDIERLALKFQQLTQQGVTFPLLVELS